MKRASTIVLAIAIISGQLCATAEARKERASWFQRARQALFGGNTTTNTPTRPAIVPKQVVADNANQPTIAPREPIVRRESSAQPTIVAKKPVVIGERTQSRFSAVERQAMFKRQTPQERLAELEIDARQGKGIAAALRPDKVVNGLVDESEKPGWGRYRYVTHDSNGRSPKSRDTKFVIIHDMRSSERFPHVLGIPTAKQHQKMVSGRPVGKNNQPIDTNIAWLHRVKPEKAHHLGRMVRETLEAISSKAPGKMTEAYINMPGGALSVGTLHVHGATVIRPKTQTWSHFGQRRGVSALTKKHTGDYKVYRDDDGVFVIAGTKQGQVERMSAKTDKLLGTMVLEAYKAALSGNKPLIGEIVVQRTGDDRIVVAVKKFTYSFGTGGGGQASGQGGGGGLARLFAND